MAIGSLIQDQLSFGDEPLSVLVDVGAALGGVVEDEGRVDRAGTGAANDAWKPRIGSAFSVQPPCSRKNDTDPRGA